LVDRLREATFRDNGKRLASSDRASIAMLYLQHSSTFTFSKPVSESLIKTLSLLDSYFYPRDAMLARYLPSSCVRLSVCPSAFEWQTTPKIGVVRVVWPIFHFDARNHISRNG